MGHFNWMNIVIALNIIALIAMIFERLAILRFSASLVSRRAEDAKARSILLSSNQCEISSLIDEPGRPSPLAISANTPSSPSFSSNAKTLSSISDPNV